MTNFDIMKKIVPLLLKGEEIECIPQKSKLNFIFHVCVYVFFSILLLWYAYNSMFDFNADVLFGLIMFSSALLFMFISSVITYMTNLMVITNQRLICFRYGQATIFKKEDIKSIGHSYQLDRYCIQHILIKAKDADEYTLEYYDSKVICEKLGL